jgi:heme/copper-type cytochrome/quinol oxidase subunit 4
VPIAVLSSGIILSHLGVAFFSFFGLLTISLYYLRKNRTPLYYTVLFGIGWISYLNYLAMIYGSYVVLGYEVATYFIKPFSAFTVVSQDLYRPLPTWAEIVFYEAIYMAIITLTPALLFFLLSRNSDKKEEYLMLAALILITSLIVGPVAAKLGGAGYITRIPQQLMPFMAIAFAEISFSRNLKPLFATMVIILVLIGSLYYYEGRNFEATLNNDYFEFLYSYAVSKPPSFLPTYYYPLRTNATLTGYTIPGLIQSYYYEYGNLSIIRQIVYDTSLRDGIIYMAPGIVIGIR